MCKLHRKKSARDSFTNLRAKLVTERWIIKRYEPLVLSPRSELAH